MANGPGVALRPVRTIERDGQKVAEPGTPWRVRWVEWVEQDGQRKRKERERYFHHPKGSKATTAPATATAFYADTLKAVQARELVDLAPPVREVVAVASFDAACAAWLRHKRSIARTKSTIDKYAKNIALFFRTARAVKGIAKDAPIPIDLLSRYLFTDVRLRWQEDGLSPSTVYGAARTALDAWTWAADDPAEFPGVPPAPRDKKLILGDAPIYSAPDAPTLAEVDACIRHLSTAAYVARGAAIVMRYTGLRISQALALTRADLDAEALTIRVRTGKSRREKADQRVIPVSRHMLAELAPYMGTSDKLIRRRRDLRAADNRNHHPSAPLSAAWDAATKAGQARLEVWKPSTRAIARPDHAFRAALQAHLVAAGVREAVIDRIVGHAPATTRGRHYVPPTFEELREAVEALPAIDWTGPQEEQQPDNVVEMRRA